MTPNEIINWLNSVIDEYPDRVSGEIFFPFMIKQAGKALPNERHALVVAMRLWLKSFSTPEEALRTDLAMAIAAAYKLSELKPDIEELLEAVKSGLAFKPYYAKFIERYLKELG